MNVHVYKELWMDSGFVYDDTQTNEEIKDGDVLVIPHEKIVGFLMQAWPVAISKEFGELHTATEGMDWSKVQATDGLRDYSASFNLAKKEMKERGIA